MTAKNLIDVHVHLCAFPDEGNGCKMSPHFQKSTLVKIIRWKFGLKGPTVGHVNRCYIDRLIKDLRESTRVARAVILALDGIYDEHGNLDENKTHMLIGNGYVHALSREHPDLFLFGASVNPQRKDAVDELERVIEKGARLIKVLPPSQVFNPLDKKYVPYYRVLAKHKVPLLSHIGFEYSVKAGNQEYGMPQALRLALDEGVTVIGAHACSSGRFTQEPFYRAFLDLVRTYPNFYVDLSALTLPNRSAMVYRLRRHPEYFNRFLFGSDYPLSAYATPFLGSFSPMKQWRLWRTKNIFDKQAEILEGMGLQVDNKVTEKLLKL